MFQELRASIILVLGLTLLTGVAYPLLMTEAGQALFPYQANGSLVEENGSVIGSEIIAQSFTGDIYFHPRPSASAYDAANSGGSNLAPGSVKFINDVESRVEELRKPGSARLVPVDLVTSSGSGLDPDISEASARFQAPRIAEAREMSLQKVEKLIEEYTARKTLGVLGENRVNVLQINRALDRLSPETLPEMPAP
ncbi:MAG: potassium-transporting ATPase subunit KdpC [Alphaproteobacteria bacterium]|nr:potassium-transporting ATPase subunit KdpC [Alphaproteobacteria bacterium]